MVGWRHVKVTDRRANPDCAMVLQDLADVHCPGKAIVLVMDNEKNYKIAPLYEAFKPAEAARLTQKFEVHHTPKHGSWLNMAEIEINVLTKQCFGRCIHDRESMVREAKAWQDSRN